VCTFVPTKRSNNAALKKMKLALMNWNEFLSAAKTAWTTEGQQQQKVHSYLLRCEKTPGMTLVQVASSAYKLYKSENA